MANFNSFLVINGAQTASHYSGMVLGNVVGNTATSPAVVTAAGGLFRIDHVVSGENTAGLNGFRLQYMQVPCGSTLGLTSTSTL